MNADADPGQTSEQQRDLIQDHLLAMQTLHRMRAFFMGVLLLALLMPVVTYGLADMDLLSPAPSTGDSAGQPPKMPVAFHLASGAGELAPPAARMMAVLLIVVYFLNINICLIGRLGSARDTIVALMWIGVLLLFLGPWLSDLLPAGSPRIFHSTSVVVEACGEVAQGWPDRASQYAKFLGLPLLGLLTAIVADLRLGRCYRDAVRRAKQRMGITIHH